MGDLPDGTDLEVLEAAVVDAWSDILCLLEEELQPEQRPNSVVSASSILAGIGALAHHVMPSPPRRSDIAGWVIEDVLDRLSGVVWERTVNGESGELLRSVWDGIAGKFTQSGRFAVAGPKEVAYAIAEALEDPTSEAGKRIRAHDAGSPSQPSGQPPLTPEAPTTLTSVDLSKELEKILQAAGRPLHIKELQKRLQTEGSPSAAASREATILLALRRATERFTRAAPGTFGLAEWGLENVPPVTKSRKVSRVKAP